LGNTADDSGIHYRFFIRNDLMSVNLGPLGDIQEVIDYWLIMRELNLFLGRPEWEDIPDIWRSYLEYDVRKDK